MGNLTCNAISWTAMIGKKTEIYKKMKASYITLTENCTYFNITKKITFLTFGQENLPNFK